MKRISFSLFTYVFIFFASLICTAQESKKEVVAKALTDYFFMERENIHVQSNKSTYMTNEQVWFKGYVFHRKKNIPFFTTVNIFANLVDQDGKILETQLVYANIGSFVGNFKLNETYKSGKYYLQFYTNWMNNFIEDESAVYEITVINPATGAGNLLAGPDPEKINIELHPEGGTLLAGVANIVGLSVSDCNHNPLKVTEIEIADAAGKTMQKIQVNKMGHGRFILPANTPSGYTVKVSANDKTHSQLLPAFQQKGIALEVNSFSVPDKTIVTLSTNQLTLDSFAGKPLYIVFHKDEDANIYDINFNGSLTTKIAVPNSDLPEGMNTIRIIDSELNQLAERLVYKYPVSSLSTDLGMPSMTADGMHYQGKVNYPNMNLSVAVLPEGTKSLNENNDIYSSLLLLPYIENFKKASGRHYFTTLSKGKMYELDLFLLSQKSRYEWNNILKNPPKSTFTFDMGLTLKGTIPKQTTQIQYARVRLYSLMSSIDETTDVNEKGEFIFKNLLMPDSAYVNFTLLRKGEKPLNLILSPQLLDQNKKFNKTYKPILNCYNNVVASGGITLPNLYQESIDLEEVTITAKKLKYANVLGNGNLTGYKISDMKANMYQNILNFIKTYGGFDVNDRGGDVTIYARTRTSVNGANPSPIIYIDNVQIFDLGRLSLMQMDEVDEIYMNSHTIIPSVRNNIGMIKIYLKQGAKGVVKNKTPDIIVKGGYKKILPFQNLNYSNTSDEGFANFGVIDWKPMIMADENGAFKLDIPKTGQKTIKVIIEGFSADGKLISEVKTLNIE